MTGATDWPEAVAISVIAICAAAAWIATLWFDR